MSDKSLPNYLHVFEQRLNSIKSKLKHQLDLPKEKREKKVLKALLKEAKKFKVLIHEVKDEHAAKCPHCGKKIQYKYYTVQKKFSLKRIIVKTISWRITGSVSTGIVAWLVTGSFTVASTIFFVQAIVNSLLYFVHELIWQKV